MNIIHMEDLEDKIKALIAEECKKFGGIKEGPELTAHIERTSASFIEGLFEEGLFADPPE